MLSACLSFERLNTLFSVEPQHTMLSFVKDKLNLLFAKGPEGDLPRFVAFLIAGEEIGSHILLQIPMLGDLRRSVQAATPPHTRFRTRLPVTYLRPI